MPVWHCFWHCLSDMVRYEEWKMWVFVFQKHGKFWWMLLVHFIKLKTLISGECTFLKPREKWNETRPHEWLRFSFKEYFQKYIILVNHLPKKCKNLRSLVSAFKEYVVRTWEWIWKCFYVLRVCSTKIMGKMSTKFSKFQYI